MADDRVVFVLHRAIVVRDSDRKGYGYPDNPVRFKDSPVPFATIGELTESEAGASVAKRVGDTDAHVEHLQMEAKIAARVLELRMEAAVEARVAKLRRQQGG